MILCEGRINAQHERESSCRSDASRSQENSRWIWTYFWRKKSCPWAWSFWSG